MAAQTADETRARWAAFLRPQLDQRSLTQSDLVRLIDRPTTVDKSVVSRWLSGKLLPTAESAIRVARVLDLPATQVLREAGQEDVANYIQDVAGSTGTSASALEPVIARVQQITEGLSDEQRAILVEELLGQIGNFYLLAEKKAELLREADSKGDAGRGAS